MPTAYHFVFNGAGVDISIVYSTLCYPADGPVRKLRLAQARPWYEASSVDGKFHTVAIYIQNDTKVEFVDVGRVMPVNPNPEPFPFPESDE